MIYLIALFVTLIPTTIGGLLSAIGIAGMDRLVKANVIAKSARAVEAAGDIDVLLLDKTGTITFGNRMADAFDPVPGVHEITLRKRPISPRWPTRHRRASRSSSWRRANSDLRRWQNTRNRQLRAVFGTNPHVWRGPCGRKFDPQGGPPIPSLPCWAVG